MKTILFFLCVCVSAWGQNLDAAKVTWVSPLITWNTGIIQYNVGVCNGRMVMAKEFVLSLDSHTPGQPNWGKYVANWVGSSTFPGPTYTQVEQPNETWLWQITGPLSGTYTPPSAKDRKKIKAMFGVTLSDSPVYNVPGWFSDTVTDTKFGYNYALGCGEVGVFLAPNGSRSAVTTGENHD